MNNTRSTVFVVDDDEAICQSLALLIEEIGLSVKTFCCAQDFLDAYRNDVPGCLVLDIRMSGMSGIELQSKLEQLDITLPVIIITGHGDIPMAVHAMKAGAIDFIEKPFRDQVLLDSIHRAIELDARSREKHMERHDVEKKIALLTPRERQIMELLVSGKSNKAIAYELGISQKTVDFHRAHILDKVGEESAVGLVRMAQKAFVT